MRRFLRAVLALVAAALAALAAPVRWVLRGGRLVAQPAPAPRLPEAALADDYADMERPPREPETAPVVDPAGVGMTAFLYGMARKKKIGQPSLKGVPKNVQLWLTSLTQEQCIKLCDYMPARLERHILAPSGKYSWIEGLPRCKTLAEYDQERKDRQRMAALRSQSGGQAGRQGRGGMGGGPGGSKLAELDESTIAVEQDAEALMADIAESVGAGPRPR